MSQRLYQRKDSPNYWVSIRGPDGKRQQISTGCRDRKAAEAVARELERRAADPNYAASHETTVRSALDRLLADRRARGRAQGTLNMYATKSGHLLRLLGEGTPLALIDAKAVDGYIDARLAEAAARNTVNKELITLRGALRVAKRRGEFTGDIAAILPVAFAPEYKPRRRALVSPRPGPS